MAKTVSKEDDKLVYVRFDAQTIRKLDRHVEKERKNRSSDVDARAITRSSVIRSALVRMLQGDHP